MTIEELQAENEDLKRQLFEATAASGMVDAQNQDLKEKVRVMENINAQQAAYITELQHREPVIENQKKRQFGYVQKSNTERGAFDMLMVSSWKAKAHPREGWKAAVYVGTATHELEADVTKIFWEKYDRYIQGLL